MPKYLIQSWYTPEGTKGLSREGGSSRVTSVGETIKKIGGKLECFYFALGDVDAYLIADLPDAAAATALSLAVNQSGLAKIRTTLLMTGAEFDAATKKSVDYRPPGKG